MLFESNQAVIPSFRQFTAVITRLPKASVTIRRTDKIYSVAGGGVACGPRLTGQCALCTTAGHAHTGRRARQGCATLPHRVL